MGAGSGEIESGGKEGGGGEREREREAETDRQTETDRQRQTDRQTDRDRERWKPHRQTDKQTDRDRGGNRIIPSSHLFCPVCLSSVSFKTVRYFQPLSGRQMSRPESLSLIVGFELDWWVEDCFPRRFGSLCLRTVPVPDPTFHFSQSLTNHNDV